jgi:beta-phosphoglucomutase family hydrolase
MNELPFYAVIFDSDGTLMDSTEIDYLAWKKIFEEHQRQLSFDDYIPMLGIKSMDVVKNYLHLTGTAATETSKKRWYYIKQLIEDKGIKPIPFVEDFIKIMKQYPVKLALATSSRRTKVELLLTKTGLSRYFNAVIAGEDVQRGKPAPDMFLEAARQLDVSPWQCIVFEDAEKGVQAAKRAGMKCVAITTTHSKTRLHKADMIIDSYKDLDFEWVCNTLATTGNRLA